MSCMRGGRGGDSVKEKAERVSRMRVTRLVILVEEMIDRLVTSWVFSSVGMEDEEDERDIFAFFATVVSGEGTSSGRFGRDMLFVFC